MTYIPSPSEKTHVLAVIELTGLTLYYADSHLSMSDGNFYEGRLEVGTLQRAFSSWSEPRQRQSTLAITLKDRDRTVRTLLESYTWGLRRVAVYVGKGRNLADYTLDFEGIIKFPGGISYDESKVRVQLRDARDRDELVLPSELFTIDAYPHLDDRASGKAIPIAYGDWSGRAVPVVCTDTTTNEFTIAGHAIKSIVQVYLNGAAVSHTNEDLTAATFRIASYDPQNDLVTVTFQGKTDDTGALITNPVGVLRDLQENYAGVDPADIDADSYDLLADELSGFAMRRYITEQSSSGVLIEELATECAFDVAVENGEYAVRSRTPSQSYDTLYDATNVKTDSLVVEYDPENLYANRLTGVYDWDPTNNAYRNAVEMNHTAQQTALGKVITRLISFKWLYIQEHVETTLSRFILLYSSEIRVIRFTGLGEAILEQLGNRVGLSFAGFEERPLLVRDVSKNFKNHSCEISGYDALSYANPGYWTIDGAPGWLAASASQRISQGFWTDDDGYASAGVEESKVSNWW